MGIRGGGAGVRGGGIQLQEYVMTFNEVLNTIDNSRHTVLLCFISFHQRTRFGLKFLKSSFFICVANIEVDQ